MKTTRYILAIGLIVIGLATNGGIQGSRHDLSTGSTNYICAFCHTPHTANNEGDLMGTTPLWNRFDTRVAFDLYGSDTLDSVPVQVNPISRLCLGCHDGVLTYVDVHGITGSTKHDLVNPPGSDPPDMDSYPNCERCHTDIYYGRPAKWLDTDLQNDHPFSMPYPTPAQDPLFNVPPDAQEGWGPNDIRLVNGYVECVSCHNPHKPDFGSFLIKDNSGSAVCLTCHIK